MSHLVNNLRAGLDIRTSFPIKSITYDNTGAILTGPNGAKLGCRKVIITAPLAVLQQERIAFGPALPAAKTAAVKRIRMGNAAKVRVSYGWNVSMLAWRQTGGQFGCGLGVSAVSGIACCCCSIYVLIAVAVPQSPAKEADQIQWIVNVCCGVVMQIIIAFNQRFWPERLYDVICTHTFVPEFWMTQHEVVDQQNKALHAVVGEQLARA
eukprot:GHUV01042707.1.p1 GENE.GHUV01042707.1~~GHUV01042707.1.p1  ORF type:complete len:209 (-),score=62.70 GHUV01042707.1:119-745(-)